MSDVFDKAMGDQQQQGAEGQSQGESQTQEQAGEQSAAGADGNGAPPATENAETQVPLSALEKVRGERKDWKEKALRLEGELTAMRRQQQPAQQQQEPRQVDPAEAHAIRSESLFLDQSERAAIKEHGKELVDKAFASYQTALQKNPALAHQIRNAADPYGEIVAMHKRQEALAEIGEDPAAYRARVRTEIEAELKSAAATTQTQAAAAKPLPASLAASRSSGSRGTTWTGPTPLTSLL